jgi:hypothetical protein
MRSLVSSLALSVSSVLGALSGLHVYWAFGGQRGLKGTIPEVDGRPLFRPGVGATLAVAFLLAVAAVLVLVRAALIRHPAPPAIARWGTWGVAAAFIGRAVGDFNHVGFFKRRRTTVFARRDTRLYSPLALALGIGAAIVAWGGG